MNKPHWTHIQVAMIAGLAFATAAHGTNYYIVTDLGLLGGPVGAATNLNSAGTAVGLSTLADGNYHATVWNPTPVDLGTIGVDTQSMAFAVNDAGKIVGVSYNYGDLSPHAFMWQAGVLTSLGNFSPHDINSAGAVAGRTTFFNAANLWSDHACVWSAGVLTDLGTLGGYNSEALAINGTGVVAGQAYLVNNMTVRACVWIAGSPHDLGTMAGMATAKSSAADLNNNGLVVGWSEVAGGSRHACAFQIDANGAVLGRTDLGILAAGQHSHAYGVNNAGRIVGTSADHGFVWEAGTLTDLNTLIPANSEWTIIKGTAINDTGIIVGEATRYGFAHGVKLTPFVCLKGDVNIDGFVDGRDIGSFVSTLLTGGNAPEVCAADVAPSYDGIVSMNDVAAFVDCVLNGGCLVAD
ncbi:MAG: DUF3466 family protein [Planctomycetes bacterium]|nr:DUF3466 family protein [Planctomycetota bacterium]